MKYRIRPIPENSI